MLNLNISEKFKNEYQSELEQLKRVLDRSDIGFFKIPDRSNLWLETQKQGQFLRTQYDKMIVIGIGGSSLGVRVIDEVFWHYAFNLAQINNDQKVKKIEVWDNVDFIELERNIKTLKDLKKVCWVIISKSGSTIETLVTTDFVCNHYKKQQLDFYKNVTVVTENRSNPLYNWAQKNKISTLEIPIDVGGRFSVLTAVGMLPAQFLGLNLKAFQEGAKKATLDLEKIAKFNKQILLSFERVEWITTFWFYTSQMRWFGDWLMQLWAESLAKKIGHDGLPAKRVSTPFSIIGSSDQHSVLQQLMEGHKDKFIIFFRSRETEQAGDVLSHTDFDGVNYMQGLHLGKLIQSQAIATQKAIESEGVSTMSIEIEKLDEFGIGYLFMFFQLAVAGLGESLKLDAFNQPGVELGKKITKEILK